VPLLEPHDRVGARELFAEVETSVGFEPTLGVFTKQPARVVGALKCITSTLA